MNFCFANRIAGNTADGFLKSMFILCNKGGLTGVRDPFGTMMGLQHCFGASPGFCVGLQTVNQQVKSLYCVLHRENPV